MFEVGLGSFCEIVDIFLLWIMTNKFDEENLGFYCDSKLL